MLENGVPGHTLLIESGDLRDVDAACEGCCLLIYSFTDQYSANYSDHIPTTVRHVVVYANVVALPEDFVLGCTGLTTVDLSPLSQVTEVQGSFLEGCTGLTTLDLSPLSQLTEVQEAFLRGCTGLTTLDLSPLSQVTEVQWSFLWGCTGLTTVDLSPLSQVTEVQVSFLEGCRRINEVDNPPPLCNTPPSGWSRVANQWVRD